MADGDGTEARLDRAERDIQVLFNAIDQNRMLLAQIPFMREDVDEIRKSTEATKNLLTAQDERHRREVETKAKEQREAEIEEKKLTWTQIGIIGSIVVGLMAALIGAIASLAAAGVL